MQNEILLSVKNLSINSEKTYSENKLVNNISFNLYKNEILGVAFGTEAGLFDDAGIPSVVFGPGHIDQAHKPDEFVAISQLEECSLFIQKMAKWSAEQ